MTNLGLPDPGVFVDWAVRIPVGSTPTAVLRAIEEAASAPPNTGDSDRDALASARSVAEAASKLWGTRNPLP